MWPLFHYHTEETKFDDCAWEAYTIANRLFAKAVAAEIQDGDIVWIHDYHLMLLPAMLREELLAQSTYSKLNGKPYETPLSLKRVRIGFFLHTPFPSPEIYNMLPVRKEVLAGVLSCDLIAVHTHDYLRHFLSSVTHVLNINVSPNKVLYKGRTISLHVFPIGIDVDKFSKELADPEIENRIRQIKQDYNGAKIVLGVDRLDYIKGVPQKLYAFEMLLNDNPEWIGKAVLFQIGIPSREDVEEYKTLRVLVNDVVARINGKFGTSDYTPIVFLNEKVDFEKLVSLYAVADACIVSSTRDGMNLVSFEYVASQQNRYGTLILSEFAGAAKSLTGAIIVNPWDTEGLAKCIKEALLMPESKRKQNFELSYSYVSKFTASCWGLNFVNELRKIKAH